MATQASTTALAVRGESQIKKPTGRDRVVWSLYHQRISIEEIAERYHTDVMKVQASLNRMEAWRALNSGDEVATALNEMVLKQIPDLHKSLTGALRAKRVITSTSLETGETDIVDRVPDHVTQMAAVEMVRKIADRNIPKSGGININNLQQNNAGGGGESPARGRGFEALLRKAREEAGLTNADNVEDAEYVDADESGEDGDEEPDES